MSWVSEALDRGVTVKRSQYVVGKDPNTHRDITQPGPYVYMFKDDPGVYYDEKGHVVSEGLARSVGFSTQKLAALRKHKQEMAAVEQKLTEAYKAEIEGLGDEKQVLAERGDWVVVGLPADKAYIEDKEGNRITMTLTAADALKLMDLTYPKEGPKLPLKTNSGKAGEGNGSQTS